MRWEGGGLPDELHDYESESIDSTQLLKIKVVSMRWPVVFANKVILCRIAKTSTSRRFEIT
jgi:hypothetical protein